MATDAEAKAAASTGQTAAAAAKLHVTTDSTTQPAAGADREDEQMETSGLSDEGIYLHKLLTPCVTRIPTQQQQQQQQTSAGVHERMRWASC